MIYIKTNQGWFYTGKSDIGQLKISWGRYAITFWDSEIKDFMFPGHNGYYKSRGMTPIDPRTKLQMWTLGDEFPLFDENEYLRTHW